VIAQLGRVPRLGDVVAADGHSFEVVELDGRRVSRVRVTRIAPVVPVGDAGAADLAGESGEEKGSMAVDRDATE
jgi:putative hemolysin